MTVVGSATLELRGDATHFKRVMADAVAQFRTVGQRTKQVDKGLAEAAQSMQQFAGNLRSVGVGLTAAVTLPLAALGAGASKAAIDFESSFAGIRKTMDLTEGEFSRLAAANRRLAQDIPVTANELNRIGELGGQLGIEGVDNVLKFERTIAQLAVTTDLTADQAALSFAQIANIMQLPQDQIDRLGAAVVGLGNNFATVESQIVEFTTRIAGAGQIAGLSAGDVAGIGTAFASLGVNAEAGGTAVQRMLLTMVSAVEQGGPVLETFARTAGMTAGQFAAAFREGAAGAFVSFVEGLGAQGTAAIGTLESLGLMEQRLTRSFLAAAGAGDLLSRAVAQGNAEFGSNTALTEEANRRFDTMVSRLKVLKNRIVDVGITLGNALLPVVGDLVDLSEPIVAGVARMAKAFSDLPKPVRLAVVGFAALAAAAGPLLFALQSAIGTLASLALIANTAIGASALGGLGALLVAGGPIVAGSIAAAGAIGFVVAKLTETGREAKRAREELDAFRESLGKPVTIGMVRDFNVEASLAAVKVAELKDAIEAARVSGDTQTRFALMEQLEEAEDELRRLQFRARQINRIPIETEATVRTKIEVEEASLSRTLDRIDEVKENIARLPEGQLRTSQEGVLERLQASAQASSNRLNELEADLATFTQSADEAAAAVASNAPTIFTEKQLKEMREQASIAARIRNAVVSAERDFFERRFRAPDLSDIGGRAFRGATVAAELDLDMVEKIGAPNVDIPDLASLSADQRQRFIEGVPFDELTGKIKSFGMQTKELLFGVGEDMVTGLIQGTLEMGDILKRFLLGFASRFILGPLSSALGIASPSKITLGFGRDIGRGFVVGMKRMEPSVRVAALGLASVAVQAPDTAARSTSPIALSAPTAAAETNAMQPIEVVLPELWTDPDATARSPGGQIMWRTAAEHARRSGYR